MTERDPNYLKKRAKNRREDCFHKDSTGDGRCCIALRDAEQLTLAADHIMALESKIEELRRRIYEFKKTAKRDSEKLRRQAREIEALREEKKRLQELVEIGARLSIGVLEADAAREEE